MGKAPELTDDQLLSDDEDGLSLDQLDEVDQHEDEVIGGDPPQKDDDLEVVILDEDEGKDTKPDKKGEEDAQIALAEDDDAGEDVDTDTPRGELTEWEKKNYNKAMQGRILRERRIKERAVAEAQQKGFAAATAIRAARTEALEAQKISTTLLAEVLSRDITTKQTELLAAKEAGESQKEVQLFSELSDLQAKKRDVENAKQRLDQVKIEEVRVEQVTQQSPDTQAWLARNKWFGNKQFSDEATFARTMDTGLAEAYKAGRFAHAPGTSQYFAELDRRIHTKMPTLRAQIRKTYGEPRRSTTTPVSRGAPSKPNSRVVTLNRSDQLQMIEWGFDPKKPADVKH